MAIKKTAMGQSAKSHQKSLAEISGRVAQKNPKVKKALEKKGYRGADLSGMAYGTAKNKTAKSFNKSK